MQGWYAIFDFLCVCVCAWGWVNVSLCVRHWMCVGVRVSLCSCVIMRFFVSEREWERVRASERKERENEKHWRIINTKGAFFVGSLLICFNAHFPDEHSVRVRFFVYSIQAEVTVFHWTYFLKSWTKNIQSQRFSWASVAAAAGWEHFSRWPPAILLRK